MLVRFGIQRKHLHQGCQFNIKLDMQDVDLNKCVVEKGIIKFYAKLYYYKGVYAKFNLDIKKRAINSTSDVIAKVDDKTQHLDIIKNDNLLTVWLKYSLGIEEMSKILSDDYSKYIVKFVLANDLYLLRCACFIPANVIQYITANQSYERQPMKMKYNGPLPQTLLGGSFSPR